MTPRLPYVRFQSPARHPRGHHPGVFALANTLAREGRRSVDEHLLWRASNDWYDANHPNPSDTDPSVYDPDVNPGAVAWFRSTAGHLIARVDGCLALLAAHGVPCVRVETSDPGRIVYEDRFQVVAVPAGPPPGRARM
ncbi:hypothetical protein AB0E11_17795 [Streptomyces fradiae]|uniref:hypothetical protein n=1 Tax=Streptomyces fradiae TaxID=1906 RepID=UPI0033DF461E